MAQVLIYPAIDLLGGEAVRLTRGLAASREYVGDPLQLAVRFAAAPLLHIVDLDGAFAGAPRQLELVARLAQLHPLQLGGGLRTRADAEAAFAAGAQRVVLGSAALADPPLIDALVAAHGADRVVAALDVKDGAVAVAGWTASSGVAPEAAARDLLSRGVRWLLVTAVHRDGTLEGPDVELLDRVQAVDPRLQIIASGGIGGLGDLSAVSHLAAAVVGKALYRGRFTLEEALAQARSLGRGDPSAAGSAC